MVDVIMAGSSGTYPLPDRPLTAMVFKAMGLNILVDAGEGTQTVLRAEGVSLTQIDVICFTHCHADHILGLPGILTSLNNLDRIRPLTIIAPAGFKNFYNSLWGYLPKLNFPVCVQEVFSDTEFLFDKIVIKAFKVDHTVTCFGYRFTIPHFGKFNEEKAIANGIPQEYWSFLQAGYRLKKDGIVIDRNSILDEDRNPIIVVYATDTRPCQNLIDNTKDADLAILEGMYFDSNNFEKALEVKHMMAMEAAEVALTAGAKELWFTHLSPSTHYFNLSEIRKVFPNCLVCLTGQQKTLEYSD